MIFHERALSPDRLWLLGLCGGRCRHLRPRPWQVFTHLALSIASWEFRTRSDSQTLSQNGQQQKPCRATLALKTGEVELRDGGVAAALEENVREAEHAPAALEVVEPREADRGDGEQDEDAAREVVVYVLPRRRRRLHLGEAHAVLVPRAC